MPPIIQKTSIADNVPVNSAISKSAIVLILGPMFISTTLTFLAVIAIMVLIAPKFAAVTKDFEVKLSPLQTMFYTVADAMGGTNGRFPLWVIAAPCVVAVMFMLAMGIVAPATRSIARTLLFILFLLAAVTVVITIISCFSPLATLMENLAKDGAKAI